MIFTPTASTIAVAADSVDHCPAWLVNVLMFVQTVSDVVGISAISIALMISAGLWILHEAKLLKNRAGPEDRFAGIRNIRLLLGTYILFGLEFMIVSDIIHSFLEPELKSLLRLGLLVLIRTMISVFLGKEIEAVRHETET